MMPRLRIALLFIAAASTNVLGATVAGIHVLDSVAVPAAHGKVTIRELSGLAFDADENLLYAVSDRGYLHHFQLQLSADKITRLVPVYSARIRGRVADDGVSRPKNAEALDVIGANNGKQGDSELLIAFEDGPSIERFTPAGKWIATLPLPGPLGDKRVYDADNNRIEAVAYSVSDGVVSAPEKPLAGRDRSAIQVFASSGRVWSYRRENRVSIKAIEVMDDSALLVLERSRSDHAVTPRLRLLNGSACTGSSPCDAVMLPVLSGKLPDANFEGMARLAPDLFLIVTDGGKNNKQPDSVLLFRAEFTRETAK